MDKELAIQSLTDTMAKFTAYIGKRLPKDVNKKLIELRTLETNPLAKSIYDSMDENQQAADQTGSTKLPRHRRDPVFC
jgi:L(+)-tartrate dehydratase alpha subunit